MSELHTNAAEFLNNLQARRIEFELMAAQLWRDFVEQNKAELRDAPMNELEDLKNRARSVMRGGVDLAL